jgi:hypothetical protein
MTQTCEWIPVIFWGREWGRFFFFEKFNIKTPRLNENDLVSVKRDYPGSSKTKVLAIKTFLSDRILASQSYMGEKGWNRSCVGGLKKMDHFFVLFDKN